MSLDTYVFVFPTTIPVDQIRQTLEGAVWVAEGTCGRAERALEGAYRLDLPARRCTVQASHQMAETLVRVLTHLVSQQYGDSVTIERITRLVPSDLVNPEQQD